jgi:hypothetical protein
MRGVLEMSLFESGLCGCQEGVKLVMAALRLRPVLVL